MMPIDKQLFMKTYSFISVGNTIRIISILLVINSFSLCGYSQRLNVDSLKKVISEAKTDTLRIIAMRKLASYYIVDERNDSLGLALLKKTEAEARKIDFQLGISEVLLTYGNYYRVNGDWANAINKYEELVE